MMTVIESVSTTVERPPVAFGIDEAQLAAVSFLARYSGRTLEAYRHDLRGYVQWTSDNDIAPVDTSRAFGEARSPLLPRAPMNSCPL
jgi:hypothetical protein